MDSLGCLIDSLDDIYNLFSCRSILVRNGIIASPLFCIERIQLLDDFIFAQFDYALSLLADGKLQPARAAYARAICQSKPVHQLRQRGLLYVAAFDIAEAARHGRILPDAAELLAQMGDHAVEAGVAPSAMPWLANPWASVATP